MANFNEKVNCGIGYILCAQEFFIYRAESMKEFGQMIDYDLYCSANPYRLFIQYKTTHRIQKIAGRCFLWDNSHGDHMADPGNGIELRSLNDASQDDCEGFGKPRFDGMESAILITDRYVFVYGNVLIEATGISQDEKHVVCTVSLCGSMVSSFRIPAQAFDRQFGLKENFQKQDQYETENDQIVAENATESTKEKETTECTTCERITNERKSESYHKDFGFDFFDMNKCLRDIDRVRYGVGSVISMMQHVFAELKDAQDNIDRLSELTDDSLLLLQESEAVIEDAMKDARTCVDEIEKVLRKSIKYRIKTA